MNIAVTSTGPTLDHQVEPRFGRCPYFLIIDSESMEFEALENPNIALGGGAGIQSAQLLAEKGVQTVLTGNCGPNAYQTLSAAGIQVILGVNGPVKKAVEQFKSGAFAAASGPSVESKFGVSGGSPGQEAASGSPQPLMPGSGMGRGMGMGMGRGRGRGFGMGRGVGAGMPPSPMEGFGPGTTRAQQLNLLKRQAEVITEQMEEIRRRISELEKEK